MANPELYANTYWSDKGKYPEVSKALHALIPSHGSVLNAAALNAFRIASNCYYDLYNNGGGNMPGAFRKLFGFDGPYSRDTHGNGFMDDDWWTQENIDRVEDRMNQIIEAAAKEQGIALPPTELERYKQALEIISGMWPDPGMCAQLVPEYVGPNDGRMRADTLWYALNEAARHLANQPIRARNTGTNRQANNS